MSEFSKAGLYIAFVLGYLALLVSHLNSFPKMILLEDLLITDIEH